MRCMVPSGSPILILVLVLVLLDTMLLLLLLILSRIDMHRLQNASRPPEPRRHVV